MKDIIREYFETMLQDGFDLENAEDNLMDMVAEIAGEFKDE